MQVSSSSSSSLKMPTSLQESWVMWSDIQEYWMYLIVVKSEKWCQLFETIFITQNWEKLYLKQGFILNQECQSLW